MPSSNSNEVNAYAPASRSTQEVDTALNNELRPLFPGLDQTQGCEPEFSQDGDPIPLTGVTIGAFIVAIFLCVLTALTLRKSGIDPAHVYAVYGGAVFFAVSLVGAFLYNAWHRRRSD